MGYRESRRCFFHGNSSLNFNVDWARLLLQGYFPEVDNHSRSRSGCCFHGAMSHCRIFKTLSYQSQWRISSQSQWRKKSAPVILAKKNGEIIVLYSISGCRLGVVDWTVCQCLNELIIVLYHLVRKAVIVCHSLWVAREGGRVTTTESSRKTNCKKHQCNCKPPLKSNKKLWQVDAYWHNTGVVF